MFLAGWLWDCIAAATARVKVFGMGRQASYIGVHTILGPHSHVQQQTTSCVFCPEPAPLIEAIFMYRICRSYAPCRVDLFSWASRSSHLRPAWGVSPAAGHFRLQGFRG